MTNLHPAAARFVSGTVNLHINGRSVPARSGATLPTINPGTGEVITHFAAADATDIDAAVRAAEIAFRESGWATQPADARAATLRRLADLLIDHAEPLAHLESLDVGKPRAQAAGFEVPHAAQTFRYYADLAECQPGRIPLSTPGFAAHVVHAPYGVCGFIFPWNFPLLLLAWGTAPALAAGNTVVIKPAEDAPLSSLYFAQLAALAGIPPGVVNVVPGRGKIAGAALAQHPALKRMSFTGSPEVGRAVAEWCGRNLVPVKLELGGKGAAVIFDDVQLEAVAPALAGAITFNAGQVCCTATRWLVHERIYDEFLDRVKAALQGTKIGYGAEPDTQLGPVVSAKQRDRVLGYVERGEREGGRVLLRGGRAEVSGYPGGYYLQPGLMAGDPGNICARDEVFGPFGFVMSFNDERSVIDAVNGSPYGLANSVWSGDLERARQVAEQLIAGTTWINGHNLVAPGIPYTCCNLSGYGGGVLGAETLRDYLRAQVISRLM